MLEVPQQLVLDRLDALSMSLKEPFFSFDVSNLVWEICKAQHLPEQKIEIVAALTGDVFLGFLHPHDFEKELRKELGIDAQIVRVIAEEIEVKIFAPVKDEIVKNYKPLASEEMRAAQAQDTTKRVIPVGEDAQRKLTVVEEKLERTREKEDVIKINPALLRMVDRSQSTNLSSAKGGSAPGGESTNTREADKPFVLFEQKGAEAPKKRGRGFSMPFGFFKEKLGSSRASAPGGAVRASVQSSGSLDQHEGRESNANNANPTGAQKPRVVHYSGERTQVTPFAQEEEIFKTKDMISSSVQHEQRKSRTNNANTPLTIEAPAAEGEVQIKKNPFSFPVSEEKTKKDGKPRLEGNTVHL